MQNLKKYLANGLKNTLLFKNNAGTSHNGPWKQVYTDTQLDRWHVGEFSSVEYTISADFDTNNKEIIKVLITASRDRAGVVVYARNNTLNDIIEITATVNDKLRRRYIKSGYRCRVNPNNKFYWSKGYIHCTIFSHTKSSCSLTLLSDK